MIVFTLDAVMADRKISGKELAGCIGLSQQNLSRIKAGRSKAVRFRTLDALCGALGCQPGDLMKYVPDEGVPQES